MAKRKLDLPPFPKLAWDGSAWRGESRLKFFRSEGAQELCVPTLDRMDAEEVDADAAPLPSPAQAAAYERLLAVESSLRNVLLPVFRERIPDLASADWTDIVSSFHLSHATIYRAEHEGESYLASHAALRATRMGPRHQLGRDHASGSTRLLRRC